MEAEAFTVAVRAVFTGEAAVTVAEVTDDSFHHYEHRS